MCLYIELYYHFDVFKLLFMDAIDGLVAQLEGSHTNGGRDWYNYTSCERGSELSVARGRGKNQS